MCVIEIRFVFSAEAKAQNFVNTACMSDSFPENEHVA